MKFKTYYNYDFNLNKGEYNYKKSEVDTFLYEPLYSKLLRFTQEGIKFPSCNDDEYVEDMDITDYRGFDISDYPLQEKREYLKDNLKINSSKNENEKTFSSEDFNSDSVGDSKVSETSSEYKEKV